jgi:UBX domain-containing protein 7
MADSGDILRAFCDVTSASEDVASQYLEAGNFDLDTAITLFFAADNHAPSQSQNSFSSPAGADAGVGAPRAPKRDMYDEDEVRKPDSVKKLRLIEEPSFSHQSMFMDSHFREPRGYKAPSLRTFASGASFDDHSVMSDRSASLAKIFETPHEIMTQGDLWSVRELCKSQEKWLLVNIQSDSSFDSHVANRDLWRDETIREIIHCSFLFWQQVKDSAEGKLYCERYKVHPDGLPHIAVLDPRTGAEIWVYRKKVSRDMFSEAILDFLGSNPYPSGGAGASTSGKAGGAIDLTSSNRESAPLSQLSQV